MIPRVAAMVQWGGGWGEKRWGGGPSKEKKEAY